MFRPHGCTQHHRTGVCTSVHVHRGGAPERRHFVKLAEGMEAMEAAGSGPVGRPAECCICAACLAVKTEGGSGSSERNRSRTCF